MRQMWKPSWLVHAISRYPRTLGVVALIVVVLTTVESLWALFSDKPLFSILAAGLGITQMPNLPLVELIALPVAFALLVMIFWQTRRKAEEDSVSLPPAKRVARESMERLCEVWHPTCHALVFAQKYFEADIMGLKKEDEHDLTARLLKAYPLQQFRETISDLEAQMERDDLPTEQEFKDLLKSFRHTVALYYDYLQILLGAAGLFQGNLNQVIATDGYRQLYERHEDFHVALASLKGRRDIGSMASPLRPINAALPRPTQ